MALPKENSSDKPSLEELLRFKRAEKPDAAFWGRFDQELHQRMMQTLVKKDPWPVQVMRALSGRMAQTAGVCAAALLLVFSVIQPGMVVSKGGIRAPESGAVAVSPLVNVEQTAASVSPSLPLGPEVAAADYRIDTVSKENLVASAGISPEYHHDSIQLASYDEAAYLTDGVGHGGAVFASTGAALIF